MPAPLAGFRIIDISERSPSAAIAGMLLADLGAEVIRVEPQGGDPLRALSGTEVWFRGQKSVIIGPEQIRDGSWRALRDSADVVITTEQPWTAKPAGLLDDWGGDPRQILSVLTAFPRSPEEAPNSAAQPVYGELIEAQFGLPYYQDGNREGPIYIAWPHAAYGAAWLLQIGTLAALFDRERTGQGQVVTTSLLDGLAILSTHRWMGGEGVGELTLTRSTIGRMGNFKMIVSLFECANNEWIQLHTGPRGAFQRLLITMDRADLVADETSSPEMSPEMTEEVWSYLATMFKTKPAMHWCDILGQADVCCMPALPPGDALWLEQMEANQMVDIAPDGTRQLGKIAKFSRTPMSVGRGAPKPGEHTAQLLQDAKPLQWRPVKAVKPATRDRVGPLDGVTVLDLGFFIAGPFSPRVMADLGARVIKVEETIGDPMRRPRLSGFLGPHRGKEEMAVDLKNDDARALVHELVKTADIFHHNLRAGSLPRLGIEYETIRAINPNIIYLHSSGYGNDGPWRSLPTLEPLHSALTGLLYRTGGEGNPPAMYLSHMDYGCALTSTVAVLAALIERERSGQGQYIEVIQTVAGLVAMSDVHGNKGQIRQSFALDKDQRGHAPTNAYYRTSDGWLLVACYSDKEWQGVRRALGLPAEGWQVYSSARNQSMRDSQAASAVQQTLTALSSAEASRRFTEEGVPHVLLAPVDNNRIVADPALRERRTVVSEQHPEAGEVIEVGHTLRFSGATRWSARPAPILGQDTVRILREIGKSDSEIERLIASGAIVAAEPVRAESSAT